MAEDLELSSAQRKAFFAGMLQAFPQKSDLKRLVVIQLGENLDPISTGDNLQEIVLDLFTWAGARGKWRALVIAAYDDNPDNPALVAFVASLGLGSDGAAPAALELPPPGPAPADSARGTALDPADRDRLRDLLQQLPALQSGKMSDRSAFLEQVGLDPTALQGMEWHGPASAFADSLLTEVSTETVPFLTPQPGYTPLGAVLRQMLREPGIADEVDRFIGDLIRRYNLIDLRLTAADPDLAALLQTAPAPTDTQRSANTQRQLDRYLDVKWLRDATRATQAVCLIERSDGERSDGVRATGFLVGPSIVLTCNYVLPNDWVSGAKFRFGYTLGDDGVTVLPGQEYSLAATDWFLAGSPFEQLDYALVRLAGTPGSDLVNGQPRSWLTPQAHAFTPDEQLFIIQHPHGGPVKVVMAANAVVSEAADHSRVRYLATTDYGSGGAPCFTNNWELVALHERRTDKIDLKEGITMTAILADPQVRAALGT